MAYVVCLMAGIVIYATVNYDTVSKATAGEILNIFLSWSMTFVLALCSLSHFGTYRNKFLDFAKMLSMANNIVARMRLL
jgi:hypothetical protein